jgi:hypothetical protein
LTPEGLYTMQRQMETIVGISFIPGRVETRTVSLGEPVCVTEAKQLNGLYEALLLPVSFIFLFLGLLPPRSKQPAGAATGEAMGKTVSP